MIKTNRASILQIVLLCSLFITLESCKDEDIEAYLELSENQADEFNDYLLGLSFDPESLLEVQDIASSSERSSEGLKESSSGDVEEFIACTREDFNLKQNFDEVAILRPTEGVIWPGALVVGDKNLLDGAPKPVGLRRSPITLTVDLPGIGDAGIIEVSDPKFSSVSLAIDKSLDWWNENAYLEGYVNASNSSYQTAISYSEEQLAMDLGLNVKWIGGKASSQFSLTTSSENKVVMLTYKQVFYKVTFDTPESPAEVFSGNVTIQDLQNIFSDNAPPAYVHSVSYGRIINYRLETSASATEAELQAALEYTSGTKKYEADLETRYQQILSESTVDVFTIGGNADVASLATGSNNLNELQSIITGENAVYSKSNPGIPIAYTVRFLNDNSLAKLGYTTEYTTELCQVYTKSYIEAHNSGAYVAKYRVTYTQDGQSKEFNSGDFTAGFTKRTDIPANALNIKFKAEAYTGILWDPLNTIVEKTFQANPGNLCYELKGTTLSTKYSTESCE